MSKSDDEKHKKPFKVCIDDCHKKAIIHEEYCMNTCFKFDYKDVRFDYRYHPHTEICYKMSLEHCQSFVECNSRLCLDYNRRYSLIPSYGRPKIEKPVSMILEYADEQSDCEDSVDYGNYHL